MPWNAAFPQPNDLISQAPTPFQNNWAFLATNIGTDHFFNTGGTQEGHHKYVQMLDGGAQPLAAGMSAALYTKSTGTSNVQQPYWINSVNTYQIPTMLSYTTAVVANVTTVVFNFTGYPRSCGNFFIVNPAGSAGQSAGGTYFWDGSTTFIQNVFVNNPGIYSISNSGTNISVKTSYTGNVTYFFYTQAY